MLVMTVAVTRNQLVAFINIDDGGGNSRLLVMQLLRVLEMSGEYRRRMIRLCRWRQVNGNW